MAGEAPYQVRWGELFVEGVTVGLDGDEKTGTGVTVVLFPPGAVGSVDVGGGGPATRETDALDPDRLVAGPDAVMLAGGSAFGLAAADGVMQALWEAGRGFTAGVHRVPIVAAACLFDLEDQQRPPGPEMGRRAAERALAGGRRTDGRVGAGAGARVGRGLGSASMPSGQAGVTLTAHDGLVVGALVVVNAMGSVRGQDGSLLAGPKDWDGSVMDMAKAIAAGGGSRRGDRTHTTLGVVVTNARLHKGACRRVARMAHDGLARAIDPVHTLFDGDAIFAVSVGEAEADVTRVGTLAAHAVAMAVRRAVTLGAVDGKQGGG